MSTRWLRRSSKKRQSKVGGGKKGGQAGGGGQEGVDVTGVQAIEFTLDDSITVEASNILQSSTLGHDSNITKRYILGIGDRLDLANEGENSIPGYNKSHFQTVIASAIDTFVSNPGHKYQEYNTDGGTVSTTGRTVSGKNLYEIMKVKSGSTLLPAGMGIEGAAQVLKSGITVQLANFQSGGRDLFDGEDQNMIDNDYTGAYILTFKFKVDVETGGNASFAFGNDDLNENGLAISFVFLGPGPNTGMMDLNPAIFDLPSVLWNVDEESGELVALDMTATETATALFNEFTNFPASDEDNYWSDGTNSVPPVLNPAVKTYFKFGGKFWEDVEVIEPMDSTKRAAIDAAIDALTNPINARYQGYLIIFDHLLGATSQGM